MSTLVMMLAAMGVPGSGPRGVPAEAEQTLALGGGWEGTFVSDSDATCLARLDDDGLYLAVPDSPLGVGTISPWQPVDEGGGRFRVRWDGRELLGVYRYEARDRVTLCFRSGGRPQSFCSGDGHRLLVLRRVQPRK